MIEFYSILHAKKWETIFYCQRKLSLKLFLYSFICVPTPLTHIVPYPRIPLLPYSPSPVSPSPLFPYSIVALFSKTWFSYSPPPLFAYSLICCSSSFPHTSLFRVLSLLSDQFTHPYASTQAHEITCSSKLFSHALEPLHLAHGGSMGTHWHRIDGLVEGNIHGS